MNLRITILLCCALIICRSSAAESTSSLWQTVARMPTGNHDITAGVIGTDYYVAGGFTSDYKGTGEKHAFDEIWALDASAWIWRTVAKFKRPRIYCATAAFEGRIWVAGGDILHEDNQRLPTKLVEIYDPETGKLTRAPDLLVALPKPLALSAAGRLWVMGSPNPVDRGHLMSIGLGETQWRVEPRALPDMEKLAGAAVNDKLYVCVPHTGLAVFDPETGIWSVIGGPYQPRSPQVAAWRGELWIMGGEDLADGSVTWIFNPTHGTWRMGPPLPHELSWGAAGVVDDHLIVTGGAWRRPTNTRSFFYADATLALTPDAIPPRQTRN